MASQESIQTIEKKSLGKKFEEILQTIFCAYGKFCSRSPWIFIIPLCGISCAVILSIGILTNFQAVTDPVKLWSAPSSRARLEKDFFDQNFNPFYRVQQLIIFPTDKSPIIYHNPDGKTIEFGPAFNRDFLYEVLKLQLSITNLTANVNGKEIRLTDLCYSPLRNNICVIQSPLGWFQNNATHFNKTKAHDLAYTYLDHMYTCINSPMTLEDTDKLGLSCLGDYGGPILPNVALADFDGKNYTLASSVAVTIMLNNHVEESENEYSLAWEKEFLEFMKNYNNPLMKITYYSEVIVIYLKY